MTLPLPAAVSLVALLIFAAARRLLEISAVDLRYQTVMSKPGSWPVLIAAAGLALLAAGLEWRILRRNALENRAAALNWPLLPLALLYWFSPGFLGLAGMLFCLSLTVGRVASAVRFTVKLPSLRWRTVFWVVAAVALLWALGGAAIQHYSNTRLALQWFDWGHYYEALTNFFVGKPFYLNLEHGSFLGSRFCPALSVLLPVVALKSPFVFFLTGSLLLASGALCVIAIARELDFTPLQGMAAGLWYLLIPGVVNLNLPLIDGFHEVLLLFPAVLGAYWCYLRKNWAGAAFLVLFSMLVRETVPFLWFGVGVVLFLRGERRRGLVLALAAALVAVAVFAWAMPYFSSRGGGGYVHTGFFPELGGSIGEIALSPIQKPGIFFGGLFSLHNLGFWATLFLPFVTAAGNAPLGLLALLPDLVMVSSDARFDSQTVLRHYQTAMLLVLIASSLAGFARCRSGRVNGLVKFMLGRDAAFPARGMAAATLTATVFGTLFFTQAPGMAAQDKRLYDWSDVRPEIAEFTRLIEPGAPVSAGTRIASHLVGKYDIFFDWLPDKSGRLERYVFIEGTSPMYGENVLRDRLLAAPEWKLLRSAMIDERQLILFEHTPGVKNARPRRTFRTTAANWTKFGTALPCQLDGVDLRGDLGRGEFRLAARLYGKMRRDFGLRIELRFADGSRETAFVLFGNGVAPATLGEIGDTTLWRFALPGARLTVCRVTTVVI